MIFEGRVIPPREGARYWEVKIPELGVFTQGRSEDDAYRMAADAVQTLIDQKKFRAVVERLSGGKFLISGNDPKPLVARWLFRLRQSKGLSLRQASARMGAASSEAWARYESGRASPTVEKLSELLTAIEPDARYIFKRIAAPSIKAG